MKTIDDRNLQLSRNCCTHNREVNGMKSYTKINGNKEIFNIVLEYHVLLYFQLCFFHQHNFPTDILYVKYLLLYVLALCPS
jgi:hypothetical protein